MILNKTVAGIVRDFGDFSQSSSEAIKKLCWMLDCENPQEVFNGN